MSRRCCCSESGCQTFFYDDTSGSSVDATKWSVSSGSWTESTGRIRTSSVNAKLVCISTLPNPPYTMVVGTGSGDGAIYRIYVSSTDYFELRSINTGVLVWEIHMFQGATEILPFGTFAAGNMIWEICVSSDEAIISPIPSTTAPDTTPNAFYWGMTGSYTSGYLAIGTGATSIACSFGGKCTDLNPSCVDVPGLWNSISVISDVCEQCGSCLTCTGFPRKLFLTMSGIAAGSGCADCSPFNTTFVLDDRGVLDNDLCGWCVSLDPPVCGVYSICVGVVLLGGTVPAAKIGFMDASGNDLDSLTKASSGTDCCAILEGFSFSGTTGFATNCIYGGATGTVSC